MGDLDELTWAQYREGLRERARAAGVPLTGTFELTPLCNFRCRMCYVRLSPGQVAERGGLRPAGEWLDVARQARELGLYRVTLTGGEPLSRPDFPQIYEGLADSGLLVSVLSNASLIDVDLLELLRRRPPTSMRFTLYGTSNETYERLCGMSGGFDLVMRSLRRLSAAGVPYSLAFTETTENIGELAEARSVAESLGVGISVATTLVPAVRGAASEADALRVPLEERPDFHECDPDDDAPPALEARLGEHDAFAMCGPYRSGFFLQWNGDMEVCGFMSWCRSRPFEVGFRAAWEDLLKKLASVKVPAKCQTCDLARFCSACPGVRYAETGRPDGIPPRLCENALKWKLREALRLREADDGKDL